MIKFFRQLRQNLIMENKTSKYLKYAIGEIVLVVIGILIALQINNWNEQKRSENIGKQYLAGIKNNLSSDNEIANKVIEAHMNPINIINSIDSIFLKNDYIYGKGYQTIFEAPDTLKVKTIFYRMTSFRSINSTYHAMISEGQSGFIKNKELLGKIQRIYDESHERIASTYESIKEYETQIGLTYSNEKIYWSYADLQKAKGKKIYSDLVSFTEQKYY